MKLFYLALIYVNLKDMVLKKITKSVLVLFVAIFAGTQSFCQSKFDPQILFAPYQKQAVTSFRSANGAPGPQYWQN